LFYEVPQLQFTDVYHRRNRQPQKPRYLLSLQSVR
jgi:hypothetical protein